MALGNFDGLHRGHMKLIEQVRRRAGERGGTPVAMIFDPHPPRVLRPDKAPPLLMTLEQKLEAFERAGLQAVAIVRFSLELSRWEPETFVETVLIDWLRVAEVWVGENFLFGRDRSGTFTLLRALGEDRGFRTRRSIRSGTRISSSRAPASATVAEGRVDEAGALLGRHYFIDGTVVHGDAAGGTLGFPTANLDVDQRAPAAGRDLRHDRDRRRRRASGGHEHRRPADGHRRRPAHSRDVPARWRPRDSTTNAFAWLRQVDPRGAQVRRPQRRSRRRSRSIASKRARFWTGSALAGARHCAASAPSTAQLFETVPAWLTRSRLTLPPTAGFAASVPEVAGRYVEVLGGSAPDAEAVALAVARPSARSRRSTPEPGRSSCRSAERGAVEVSVGHDGRRADGQGLAGAQIVTDASVQHADPNRRGRSFRPTARPSACTRAG